MLLVLVILAVAGFVAWKVVGGAAEKLASALAPLSSISMVDIANKADVIAKAQTLNPAIAVFQMKQGAGGKLEADRSE